MMSVTPRQEKPVSESPLDRALARFGVPATYAGVGGVVYRVPERTKEALLAALRSSYEAEGLTPTDPPPSLPVGVRSECYLPASLSEQPAWGITLQLYELRSARNWGIGDFEDLGLVCEIAGRSGASFVGLTPLHALFMADPQRCSPYSPSNRSFLNPLYIAVDRLAYAPDNEDLSGPLEQARAVDTVDYGLVGALKTAALRRQWKGFTAGGASAAEEADFRQFAAEGGSELLGHALFETLSFFMVAEGHGAGWRAWPDAYRDRSGDTVRRFQAENEHEISFHIWLQWLATRQLEQAARRGLAAGLTFGLYFDYAVGEAPDGSATWSNASDYLPGFSIGAPPDPFSESGQDWGLALPSPSSFQGAARERRERQFSRILGDGGLFRLDHVMGLWQLFAVPADGSATEGAYIRYPIDQALDMLARASRRSSTIVIGEDLGNVPTGFRELLQSAAVLSYRVLYFEDLTTGPLDPQAFPEKGLVCVSTHDLYPLKGWWQGHDIDNRVELGLLAATSKPREMEERKERKQAIVDALKAMGAGGADVEQAESTECGEALTVAVHVLLARSPCVLLAARLADLLGEEAPTNVPGTPADMNWRRKVAVPVEDWQAHRLFDTVTQALARERPRR